MSLTKAMGSWFTAVSYYPVWWLTTELCTRKCIEIMKNFVRQRKHW